MSKRDIEWIKRAAAAQQARDRQRMREAAATAWGSGDAQTRQRTAMVIAAFLLDQTQESTLADWLLWANPAHAREVATGVAVHALRRNQPAVWDALIAADAMDHAQASEWFDADATFIWQPDAHQLHLDPPAEPEHAVATTIDRGRS